MTPSAPPQSGAITASGAPSRRRLGAWSATAMIITETIGVGIFLTPATMLRTLGTVERVLELWAVMGALTMAGALCYAELSTRYPRAGGGYVYLRQAFGPRCAFVYGWMALLVMDPGLTAALGIGGAQYLLAAIGAPTTLLVPAAIALIIGFGALTLVGVHASGQVLRWTALAKLVAVGTLVLAAIWRSGAMRPATAGPTPLDPGMLAPAVIAAFFAFGGWWDLGRMAEDIESPSRTMPRALLGGVAVVAVTYALASVALVLAAPAGPVPSDAELVNLLGAALFGAAASHTLAAIVVIAVAGSLAAVLLGAPRVYLAMTRDHLFPSRLVRFDETRGTMAGATLIQVVIACVLVIVGSFDAILGYFVPGAVFFLGLSAAAVLVLPRPRPDDRVFRAPMHPLPLLLFLVLIVGMLALFIAGQPRETLLGGAVIALGIPASYLFIGHRQRRE